MDAAGDVTLCGASTAGQLTTVLVRAGRRPGDANVGSPSDVTPNLRPTAADSERRAAEDPVSGGYPGDGVTDVSATDYVTATHSGDVTASNAEAATTPGDNAASRSRSCRAWSPSDVTAAGGHATGQASGTTTGRGGDTMACHPSDVTAWSPSDAAGADVPDAVHPRLSGAPKAAGGAPPYACDTCRRDWTGWDDCVDHAYTSGHGLAARCALCRLPAVACWRRGRPGTWHRCHVLDTLRRLGAANVAALMSGSHLTQPRPWQLRCRQCGAAFAAKTARLVRHVMERAHAVLRHCTTCLFPVFGFALNGSHRELHVCVGSADWLLDHEEALLRGRDAGSSRNGDDGHEEALLMGNVAGSSRNGGDRDGHEEAMLRWRSAGFTRKGGDHDGGVAAAAVADGFMANSDDRRPNENGCHTARNWNFDRNYHISGVRGHNANGRHYSSDGQGPENDGQEFSSAKDPSPELGRPIGGRMSSASGDAHQLHAKRNQSDGLVPGQVEESRTSRTFATVGKLMAGRRRLAVAWPWSR